jgi:hypothetical protein
MTKDESIELLSRALMGAEAAHAKHEEIEGKPDPDWPKFYARWILTNCDLGMIGDHAP